MTEKKSNTLPGFLSFIVLAFIISACMTPVFRMAGSFTIGTDFSINMVGSFICPEDTTPRGQQYQTTRRGSNGSRIPSTETALQCVNEQGTVVLDDRFMYPLIWSGGSMIAGVTVALLLAVIFAVPGGKLVSPLLEKIRGSKGASKS